MEQKIFLPGQPVIYLPTTPQGSVYKVEYGIVKHMSKDGKSAHVWYHSGCTAASTPIEYLVASLVLPQHEYCHKGCDQCINDPDIEFTDDEVIIGEIVFRKEPKR